MLRFEFETKLKDSLQLENKEDTLNCFTEVERNFAENSFQLQADLYLLSYKVLLLL